MALPDAISTKEMTEKLMNLQDHMPGEEQFVYDFAEFFGKRLGGHPTIVPGGFNMVYRLALHDLQKGIDGFTGQPTPHSISGMPPVLYAAMAMNIPRIAEAVCPEDFADKVKKVYEEINQKVRAEQSK